MEHIANVISGGHLHGRRAVAFVEKARALPVETYITVGKRRVRCMSLLGVLSLGIRPGVRVCLTAERLQGLEEPLRQLAQLLVREEPDG